MYVYRVPAQRKPRTRAPHQLPPGRHKLSRDYVESNQRQRIFDAIADVTSLAGYAAMSVEQITGTAGVSRRTFYDAFTSKEDAFLAALDSAIRRLVQRVRRAYRDSDTFPEGVRNCLSAFLDFLADDPRYADMLIVEVLAAGTDAIERRNEMMMRFADLLRRGAETEPHGLRPPELTAETIVGGIYEVVYSRILQGQATELPALPPDLAYSMMQPYIGHDRAKREVAKPPARDSGHRREQLPRALDDRARRRQLTDRPVERRRRHVEIGGVLGDGLARRRGDSVDHSRGKVAGRRLVGSCVSAPCGRPPRARGAAWLRERRLRPGGRSIRLDTHLGGQLLELVVLAHERLEFR